MIPESQRRMLVMMHEGQLLAHAGQHGCETASDLARCVIDGALNALIRTDGREEAAKYAFAAADRVVGGIKAPTAWPLACAPIAQAAPPAVPAPPKAKLALWEMVFAAFVRCLPR